MPLTDKEQRDLRQYNPTLSDRPPGIDLGAIIDREVAVAQAAADAAAASAAAADATTDELVAALTATAAAEDGDAVVIDVAWAGAAALTLKATIFRATTMQVADVTEFVLAETGEGTELTPTARPVLFFTTDASGNAALTVTDVAGASGETVHVEIVPFTQDGNYSVVAKRVAVTFD